MNYRFSSAHQTYQSNLTQEEFDRITHAIMAGRYSWACVLILRFIGYNPLHYIPQRTYSRLIKDNEPSLTPQTSHEQRRLEIVNTKTSLKNSHRGNAYSNFSQVENLEYLAAIDEQESTKLAAEFKQIALIS